MSVLDYEQVQPKASDKPLPGHKLEAFGSSKNVGYCCSYESCPWSCPAKSGVKVLRIQPFVQHQGRPEGVLGPPPQQLTACPYRAARGSRMGGWHPSQLVGIPTFAHCAVESRGVAPEAPKSPQRPTRQSGAGRCQAAPAASRQDQGLPRTLTPESLACASARCTAQTGSGTGGQQTHRLCQRRQGGNRSGCHHEPVWESKTPLWAGQPRSPVTALLHIKHNIFYRLKRSGSEKQEYVGPGCSPQASSLGEEQ